MVKNRRWRLVVLGAVAALVVVLLWRRGERPTAPTVKAQPVPAPAAPAPAPPPPALAGIAGRVTGDAGTPVPGAVVELVADDDRADKAFARTGADGGFRLTDLRPGRYTAGASAAGFLPTHVEDLVLVAGKETPLDLRLEAGGRPVSGTVTDRTGGTVAGALVEVTPLHGLLATRDRRSAAALTDDAGRYLVHVPEGRHRVAASHPDYVGDARAVDVGAGGAKVDFALLPGAVIEGLVREHGSGAAVGGALVSYDREALAGLPFGETVAVGRRHGTAVADGSGHFRLTGLEPGTIRIGARAPGRASREPAIVSVGVAAQVSGVEVFVGGAFAVRGRVAFEGGEPAAGAAVEVFGEAGRGDAVADAQGRFAVEGMPPGAFLVTPEAEGSLPGQRPKRVELRDRDVDGLELTLGRGAYVDGRVEPAEIAEVSVEVDPQLSSPGRMAMVLGAAASSLTRRDGSFRLGPLALGPATIAARAADGRRGTAEVKVTPDGVRDVVIRLEERGAIAGRVVDESGAPVPGSVVTLRRVEDEGQRQVQMIVNGFELGATRAPASAIGRFVARGLSAGSYELTVRADDGEPLDFAKGARPPRVALKTNEQRDGVDLVVEVHDGAIRGTVLGPDGQALTDAWVTAMAIHELAPPGAGGGPRMEARTYMISGDLGGDGDGDVVGGVGPARALSGDDGRFAIAGLRRGKYRLLAEGLGGKARGMLDGVETGSDVTLRLAALRVLEGKVTSNGKPVAELTVELEGPNSRRQTFFDAGGAFAIQRVDPGSYRVKVTAPEGFGAADAVVAADPTVTAPPVTIALSANGRVVGKIVKPDGTALAGAAVLTAPDTGDGRLMIHVEGQPPTTAADGSFALNVPMGKHLLVVLADEGGPAVRHPFTIAAGQTVDLGPLKASSPQ